MAETNLILKLKDQASKGLDAISKAADGVANSLKDVKTNGASMGQIGGLMTAGITAPVLAAYTAISGLVTVTALAADNIDKMAERTGISRTSLQELQYAAQQTGVDFKSLDGISAAFAGRLQQIEAGAGPAAAAFNGLGLSTKDASGALKSSGQVFEETLMALAGMEDGAERGRAAIALLGPEGAKLAPLLNQGAEGIDALRARANELGLVMGDESISAFVAFGDAIADLQAGLAGFRNAIAVAMLPVLEELTPILVNEVAPAIAQVGRTVGELIAAFLRLEPQTRNIYLGIIGISAAIGPALILISNFVLAWNRVVGVLRLIGPALVGIGRAILNMNPIMRAITVAIGLFYLAWNNNFLGIQEIVNSAVAYIGRIMRNIPAFWNAIKESTRILVDYVGWQFRQMGEILRLRLDIISATVQSWLARLRNVFNNGFVAITQGFFDFVETLANIINPALELVGMEPLNVDNFMSGLRNAATAAAEESAQAVENAEARIADANWSLVGAIGAQATMLDGTVTAVREVLSTFDEGIESVETDAPKAREAVEDLAGGFDTLTTAVDTANTSVTTFEDVLAAQEDATALFVRKYDLQLDEGLLDDGEVDRLIEELQIADTRLSGEIAAILNTPNFVIDEELEAAVASLISRRAAVRGLLEKLVDSIETESLTLGGSGERFAVPLAPSMVPAADIEDLVLSTLDEVQSEIDSVSPDVFIPYVIEPQLGFDPVTVPLPDVQVVVTLPEDIDEVLTGIQEKVADGLGDAERLGGIFGESFDVAAEKTRVLESALTELGNAGYGADNTFVQELLAQLGELEEESLSALDIFNEYSASLTALGSPNDASLPMAERLEIMREQIALLEATIESLRELEGDRTAESFIETLVPKVEDLQLVEEFNTKFIQLRESIAKKLATDNLDLSITDRFQQFVIGLNALNGTAEATFGNMQSHLQATADAAGDLNVAQSNLALLRGELELLIETFGSDSNEVTSFFAANLEEMRSLTDEITRLGVVSSAFDVVKNALQEARAETDGLSQAQIALRIQIIGLQDALDSTFDPAEAELLAKAIDILDDQFKEMAEEAAKVKLVNTLGEIKSAVNETAGLATDMMEEFGASDQAIESVNQLGGAVDSAFSAAMSFASGDIIGGIVNTVKAIWGVFKWLRNLFKSQAQKDAEAAAAAWEEFVDELARSFQSAIHSALGNAMKDFLMNPRESYGEAIAEFRQTFRDAVYSSVLDGLIEALIQKTIIEAALGPLMEQLAEAAAAGNWGLVGDIVSLIGDQTEQILNQIEPVLNELDKLYDRFYGTDQISKPVIDYGPVKDVEDSVKRVINDYTSALEKTEGAASEFGEFASRAVSIPLYDASIRFSDSVNQFGQYVNTLVSQGIMVHAQSNVTVNNTGIPAYN